MKPAVLDRVRVRTAPSEDLRKNASSFFVLLPIACSLARGAEVRPSGPSRSGPRPVDVISEDRGVDVHNLLRAQVLWPRALAAPRQQAFVVNHKKIRRPMRGLQDKAFHYHHRG